MKLKQSSSLTIAKKIHPTANTVLESLDYQKWKKFIDKNKNVFIWNEKTKDGKNTLENINEFSERLKIKILSTLNKSVCFSEYNDKKEVYNVSVTFYEELNWIAIQFSRKPRLEDLKLYIDMANHLDALLLVDGTKIINEETLKDLS